MTSPGGKSGIDLTALWVPILPETSKLASGVEAAGRDAKNKFEKATEGMGKTMAQGVEAAVKQQQQLMETLAGAAQRYERANRGAEDAAGKLHTTQVKLQTVMNNSKSTTVQIATATEAYSRAQRAHTAALGESQRATQTYHQAQSQLSQAMRDGGNAAQENESKTGGMFSSLGVKAGATAGLVAEGVHLVAEAASEMFEKSLEVGKEVIEHLMEIGEAWENVEHQIELHSNAGPEQLEALNHAAEQIAASGAPVKLDQLGSSLAIISTRLKGLDGEQLKTFTTHVLELSERMGEPINVNKLTGALNGFGIPAKDADKALESIVHTAQSTGVSINQVVEGIAKAGPAARALGLNIGQVGGFISALSMSGVDPQRAIMALSTAAGKFAKDQIPLNEGLKTTVARTRELLALGTAQGDSKAYKQVTDVFGARGGAAIFDQIKQGTLNLDDLAAAAQTGGESLDDLIDHTQTLDTRLEGMKNRLSEALRPVGVGLVTEMGKGLDQASEYISTHTTQIIGWLKTAGDYGIGFVHTMAEMGAGTLRAFGYMDAAGTLFLREFIRGLSSLTGYIGGFLDTIGMDGMGRALKDLSASGTALADGMDKLPDLFGAAADGLDRLADSTGSSLQTGFDGFMDKVQTSAAYTQALGDAILHVPDDKHVTIENNTPETSAALKKLGIEVEQLPDGTIQLLADNKKAAETFKDYVKEVEGKDVEVELRAKPEDNQGNPTESATDARQAIEKMFGLDQGPFNVPMAAGSDPFAIPGSPGGAPGSPGGAPSGLPGPLGQLGLPPGTVVPHGGTGFTSVPGGPQAAFTPPSTANIGAEGWRATVASVVNAVGPQFGVTNTQAWTDALVRQIDTESHGNPGADNPHDSNGQGGTQHVSGLLQFLASTYAANNVLGRPFPDPIGEIAAAISLVSKHGMNPDGSPKVIGQGHGFYATGYTPSLDGSGGSLPDAPHNMRDIYSGSNLQNYGKQDKESRKPWWMQALDFVAGTADHSFATGYTETVDGSGGSLPDAPHNQRGLYSGANLQNYGKQDKESRKPWWMQALDFVAGTADHSFATGYTPGLDGQGGSRVGGTPHGVSHLSGASPASIDAWIAQAVKITGVDPAQWTSRMATIIGRESKGDPMAINDYDINAIHGDPSRGLAQVIGSTFAQFHVPGTSDDIYDPIANIAASIRYQQHRYGSAVPDQGNPNAPSRGYAGGSGAMRMIKGPGTGTSDSIFGMLGAEPIRVSNGESINTALSTAMNLPWLRAMNKGLILPGRPRGFAGGFAGDNSDSADPRHGGSIPGMPTGMGQDLVDFMKQIVQQYNAQTGSQLMITGDRAGDNAQPGDVGHTDDGGQHSVNRAVDIGGPAAQRAAFIQWWESDPGRTQLTRQLIASGLGGDVNQYEILGGQRGSYNGESMSDIYSADNPNHGDHIHIALQALPGSTGAGNANMGVAFAAGNPTAGGAPGNGGYQATQYPGYFLAPDGSYVTADQIRNQGNYGGATRAEIDSALKARDQQQQSLDDHKTRVAEAQKSLDDLKAGKPTADGLGVKPATQDEIDKATEALARATREQADAEQGLADANQKYADTINKPPEAASKTAKGSTDKNAETLGGGLVKGALQELGFDGSVFEDPTQWGIWKLFTGGVNYAGGLMKNAAGGPTGAGGAMGAPFGGGGGGGLLESLFGGLMQSTGINLPVTDANAAATVSTAPGVPGLPSDVSAPGTVVPGGGQPFGAQGAGPLPGPPQPGGVTINGPTFNGITDVPTIAGAVGTVQTQQSRALNVGPPIGGLPAPSGG